MSGLIFISYRREESRWSARSLYDRLSASFGPKQIFMDIDAIALGEDFIKAIERTVSECDVLIAVIGASWLTSKDDQGDRRLNNPEDFVRMEVATALSRDIRVIPVLVDGALMPRPTELPDDLKPLVRRNALRISDTSFDGDCQRLVAAIKQVLETERLEAQQREKCRVEAEQRERESLDAERREKERLEAEARQRKEEERPKAEQQNRERVEHPPRSQPPAPVAPFAPSIPFAKPEADKSAQTPKVVPLAPKPAESEREKLPSSSSGGTGGKSHSKQVIAFLAIAAVLVVGGLIYLAIRASQSPPPQPAPVSASPSQVVIATPTPAPSPSINSTPQARQKYEEALKNYRELAQKDFETYLPDVARTLFNLANLDNDERRQQEALTEWTEALQIYRELAQKDPKTYLPDVAHTLNNLGTIHSYMGQFPNYEQPRLERARTEFAEALQIYETLAKQDPKTFSQDVTRVKTALAELPK
jgi:tetratricopeptide (TPR) repeat protein